MCEGITLFQAQNNDPGSKLDILNKAGRLVHAGLRCEGDQLVLLPNLL